LAPVKRLAVVVLLVLAPVTNAKPRDLLTPPTPRSSIPTRIVRGLAEQWANQGDSNQHSIRCHRWVDHVGCRIDYYNIRLPYDAVEDGVLVPIYGRAWEYVRIVRRNHRCTLTSDVFPGRLVRSC
jgi:hypothetical protein